MISVCPTFFLNEFVNLTASTPSPITTNFSFDSPSNPTKFTPAYSNIWIIGQTTLLKTKKRKEDQPFAAAPSMSALVRHFWQLICTLITIFCCQMNEKRFTIENKKNKVLHFISDECVYLHFVKPFFYLRTQYGRRCSCVDILYACGTLDSKAKPSQSQSQSQVMLDVNQRTLY